jgi:hypothetical protein
MSAYKVMANILHMAQKTDEKLLDSDMRAPAGPASPISAFVVAGRGSQSGRGRNNRGGRGGRGLPNKCSVCGGMDHILSSCTASDDAIFKWTLAKRKLIIPKYGSPGGTAPTYVVLLSDVSNDDYALPTSHTVPTLEECIDEYDDNEVSVPFSFIAFSSSLAPGRGLSQSWMVDSASSINLTTFRGDFATFDPPFVTSRVGGVGIYVNIYNRTSPTNCAPCVAYASTFPRFKGMEKAAKMLLPTLQIISSM